MPARFRIQEEKAMSSKLIYDEVAQHSKQLATNEITAEAVKQKIRDICFAEPKVPAEEFLETVRSFDPKFAPSPEGPEVQKRAEICKKAQEGMLDLVMHEQDRSTDGLSLPGGNDLHRAHKILIQGLPLEEKQKMATLLLTDEEAAGQLIYDRLAPKKDQILSMLDLNDEDLVNNYFPLADEFSLIAELQTLRMICKFTPEQDQELQELYDNMDRFSLLERRIDMISNPYYAKYPIEGLPMSNDDSYAFNNMLANLATAHGEKVGTQLAGQDGNMDYLRGPTHMLGDDYFGMRSYSVAVVEEQAKNYLKQFGKNARDESILWADTSGKTNFMGFTGLTNDLFERKPIFINIPGVGAKAVYNTAANPLDCKLEEVPDKILSQYMHQQMQDKAKAALAEAEKANPFLLSVFSGSRQYNTMLKCMAEAEKARQALKYPLDKESEETKKALEAIAKLEQAQAAYMKRKEDQGLQRDSDDNLVGRTTNEVKRLAAARTAEELVKTLKFQLGYQLDPESASAIIVQNEKTRKRRNATDNKKLEENKKPEKTTVTEKLDPLTDEEKIKGSKEQMLGNNVYQNMPACKASDAGDIVDKMRSEASYSIDMLARRANQNQAMDSTRQAEMRLMMAKVVLFEYVLRERVAINGPNAENIVAGPVEKALNESLNARSNAASQLAKSEGFKKLFEKVTPAQIENFVNNKEARKQDFDKFVQESLPKPKENTAAQQQMQQSVVQQQPKPAPKVNNGPQ